MLTSNFLSIKSSSGVLAYAVYVGLSLIHPAYSTDSVSLNPKVYLSDGAEFKTWENQSAFSKTYYVDQNHAQASDTNAGTEDSPFRTINCAAQRVRAGERVVVNSGVYRELIRPRFGGKRCDKMISYEAAAHAKVIVKGSRVIKGWIPSKSRNSNVHDGIWMLAFKSQRFEEDNPFLIENASQADIEIMPWAKKWAGKLPYTLGRGLVFQDGQRLAQVAEYGDMQDRDGTYWVDRDDEILHIRPFGDVRPANVTLEITTQQHIFMPERTGLGFIRVKGFIFEHAGNGLPRTGVGAVYTKGGHHWIIEDNIVRQVHSVGIEIGARTDESPSGARTDMGRAARNPGCMIVRRNELYECGTGGIQGLRIKRALVEDNHIHHCGWMNVQRYWETGAIKLLLNLNTLVRSNLIHDIQAAPAIWMDYDNINSRVSRNVIYNVESSNGAIFIEASQVPNLVDHNIVINTTGSAIYQHDCDELTVAHNLVFDSTKQAVEMRICSGRRVNGRLSTCKRNRVLNNIFVRARKGVWFIDEDNVSDRNIFVDCADEFDFAQWQESGFGAHSLVANIDCRFDATNRTLTWSTDQKLPSCGVVEPCSHDFFDHPRNSITNSAGPWPYPTEKPQTLNLYPSASRKEPQL
jgi:alpha-L-arabinofuranosidase